MCKLQQFDKVSLKKHQFNFKHFVTLGPISGLRVWGGDPYYQ